MASNTKLSLMKRSLLFLILLAFSVTALLPLDAEAAKKKASRKRIAYEGGSFSFTGTKTVRFGTKTRYIEKKVTKSGLCTTRFFSSDPAPYQLKECSIKKPVKKKKKGGGGGGSSSSSSSSTPITPVTVNGTCGSAHGASFSSAPTTNLCTSGTASSVSGSGPYVWSCTGSSGGATANCSASSTAGIATALTLSGPSGGTVNTASTNFTIGANGTISGTITITPSVNGGGGTFSPTTLSLTSSATTGTFTYTPTSVGSKTISIANNGGLSNPGSLVYVVNEPIVGGVFSQLGTQTLATYMDSLRSPEDRIRLSPAQNHTYYNGAVLWKNKYAFPIAGGHAGDYDDGFYAFDLTTNSWETIVPFTSYADKSATVDISGEWTLDPSERPASQHSYDNVVTVGDNIIQGYGGAIGNLRDDLGVNYGSSQQAHRFNDTLGVWERYGNLGGNVGGHVNYVHYDSVRNRIVRIDMRGNSRNIDTIPANDKNATWTALTIALGGITALDIGASIGYHPALDVYIRIGLSGQVLVMDPDALTAGWVSVSTSGTEPSITGHPGLAYIPPMQAFASVDPNFSDRLYYLRPTGTATDPWVWSNEIFTGSTTAGAWNNGELTSGVYSRIQWSDGKRGLVICKDASLLMELFVPMEVAAYYDWQDRTAAATAAGVATGRGSAFYDFSEQPANGGDWKFGSIQASPKITVEVPQGSRTYDTPASGSPDHARDLTIYPPGSRGSLRMTMKSGVHNATDNWRLSVDEYSKQFGAGDEFWVSWRTRMNATYATHRFKTALGGITGDGLVWDGNYTEFKHTLFGYGMQYPYGPGEAVGHAATYYGYTPGANQTDNVLTYCQADVKGEIVMISQSDQMAPGGPAGWMKYPQMYVSKFFDNLIGRGQNINYYSSQNQGVEAYNGVKACEFTDPGGGVGNQYTDYTSCFIYPTDEWFSLMIHVVLGAEGTAVSNVIGSPTRTGYTGSTVEYYGAYEGQSWQLLHRRTNIVIPTDTPGAEGPAKFGIFDWTTYMTNKLSTDVHPDAIVWVSQIILQPGATMPAAPR